MFNVYPKACCFLVLSFFLGSQLFSDEKVNQATAVITPTKGNEVEGKVKFVTVEGGVHITADVKNLKPGLYGFHVHEFGDCGGDEASLAGGHFNPTKESHSCPEDSKRHLGDMGNIIVNDEGVAYFDEVNKQITLDGANSVIGKAVIIHQGKDDCKTQPSGGSGKRIGCGIIKADK